MPGFGTTTSRDRHRLGAMRHKGVIEHKVSTGVDSKGQDVFTWKDFVGTLVPCQIKQLFGRELENARSMLATATHRVRFRYIPGVNEDMRLNFSDRYFYFGVVENVEESNRFMSVVAEEKR